MTKKFLILAGMLLFMPVFCFSSYDWERNPSGYYVTSPLNVWVDFEEPDDFIETCATGTPPYVYDVWYIMSGNGETQFSATSSVSYGETNFSISLPLGEYWFLYLTCFNEDYPAGIDLPLEESAENPIFEVVADEENDFFIFQLPKNAISSTTEFIDDLINAVGPFIWLFIGIPLGFVVIRKIIKILPR